MSIAQKAIDAIKAVLKFETTPTTVTAKLKDGTEVSYTTLAAGGSFMIAGAPAPEGTYELEDGTSVVVDATGTITAVNGVTPVVEEAQATPPATVPPVTSQAHQKYEITEELQKPDGIRTLLERFATGTPEERIANLEMVAKALMEYTFGWEIREQQQKADREAAIKIYKDNLTTAQAEIAAQREAMSSLLPVLEELAKAPVSDPPSSKKKFGIVDTDLKNKSLNKYRMAIEQVKEEVGSKLTNKQSV